MPQITLGTPSSCDVYLSPHSDDVCFSIGSLCQRRQTGILMTVFSRSSYQVRGSRNIDEVTLIRKQEDKAFADICGLTTEFLDLPDAPMRGFKPLLLEGLDDCIKILEATLLPRLLNVDHRSRRPRPSLFAPCGIGNHTDHVGTMMVIMRNYAALSRYYRIHFYEDQHYASDPVFYLEGMNRMGRMKPGRVFARTAIALQNGPEEKLRLLSIYKSQFTELPKDLKYFTAARSKNKRPLPPHEGLWTLQPKGVTANRQAADN